jgi:hypothetical protein
VSAEINSRVADGILRVIFFEVWAVEVAFLRELMSLCGTLRPFEGNSGLYGVL